MVCLDAEGLDAEGSVCSLDGCCHSARLHQLNLLLLELPLPVALRTMLRCAARGKHSGAG